MDESGRTFANARVNIDVTERKQMEEALSNMSRKLLESQSKNVLGLGESFTTTSTNGSRC